MSAVVLPLLACCYCTVPVYCYIPLSASSCSKNVCPEQARDSDRGLDPLPLHSNSSDLYPFLFIPLSAVGGGGLQCIKRALLDGVGTLMAAHHRMLGPDCVPLLLERLEGCLMGNDPCLRWSLLHMTEALRWGQ
jgi:hypothetical protein